VWIDPHAGWQDSLFERLLEQRIVLAAGVLTVAEAIGYGLIHDRATRRSS